MGKKDDYADAGLSEEEIAALTDDSEDEIAELDSVINSAAPDDDGTDDDGINTDDDGIGTDDDGITGATATTAAAKTQEAAEGTQQADDTAEFSPRVHLTAPENYDDRMQEYASQKIELRKQLSEGDISLDEYEEKKDVIVNAETELKLEQRDYQNAVEATKSAEMQKWQWTQEQFFEVDANKIYKDSPMLMAALDASVKQLAHDPANSHRGGGWFLREADRRVREMIGGNKEASAKPAAAATRKPDLRAVPKTLSGLPAAELNETSNDEFAKLDNLDGMELEAALAKMTEEQQARYLRAG